MKRTVFILIGMALCLVLADKVQAQRCLPGMKGLRLTAGMADGFHSASRRNELGYHFGLSMDSYTKGCSRWVFGAEYLQKYHPYKDTRLPVSQFTAEGGYYYNYGDHFYPDGARSEGLIAAYYLAKKQGEEELAAEILDTAKKAAKCQFQLFNDEKSGFSHRNPAKSAHGIRFKATRQWVRVDSVQHVACFFIRLYWSENPVGSGTL